MGYKKEPKCPVPPAQKPGGGSGKVYFLKFNFSLNKKVFLVQYFDTRYFPTRSCRHNLVVWSNILENHLQKWLGKVRLGR